MFGRVLAEEPTKRGKDKIVKLEQTDLQIKKTELPHLNYSNSEEPTGNWFFVQDGNYYIFSAIRSTYEKVKHLEGISVYADMTLRLRIVIELLKRNVRDEKVSLTDAQFKEIAFKVFKAEPSAKKVNDSEILQGIDNWLPSMLMTPLFEEIPENYREQVRP